MGPVRQNPIPRTVSLFICVCIALCTIVAHNIAQNRPDNFPLLPSRQSPLLRWCLFEGRGVPVPNQQRQSSGGKMAFQKQPWQQYIPSGTYWQTTSAVLPQRFSTLTACWWEIPRKSTPFTCRTGAMKRHHSFYQQQAATSATVVTAVLTNNSKHQTETSSVFNSHFLGGPGFSDCRLEFPRSLVLK